MSQTGVLMFVEWSSVNTENEKKKSLCVLSCSDPLILPTIDIFLLIVSHYISSSGYWCSSCAVSLWCLLNVSICSPISCFFMHSHLLLSIGHQFVLNHSYLQCSSGEERGMTVCFHLVFYFCGHSFWDWLVVYVLCSPLISEFVPLRKKQYFFLPGVFFTRLQAAGIPSWQDLGIFDSRRVIARKVKVPGLSVQLHLSFLSVWEVWIGLQLP